MCSLCANVALRECVLAGFCDGGYFRSFVAIFIMSAFGPEAFVDLVVPFISRTTRADFGFIRSLLI